MMVRPMEYMIKRIKNEFGPPIDSVSLRRNNTILNDNTKRIEHPNQINRNPAFCHSHVILTSKT
jgi:hypothetical protein